MSSAWWWPFVLFTLSDYYVPSLGGRILDYVGIAILVVVLVMRPRRTIILISHRMSPAYFTWIAYSAPLLALGAISGEYLAAGAFLVGATLIYVYYRSSSYDFAVLRKQLDVIIGVYIAFFWIQYATFYVFGHVIDLHSPVGAIHPRIFNEDLGFFRAAGLFQEPNSLCLTLFLLGVLRAAMWEGRQAYILGLIALTMVASESLWGFGAAVLLLGMSITGRPLKLYPETWAVIGVVLTGAVVVALVIPGSYGELFSDVTVGRILNIGQDPSAYARYRIPDPWWTGIDTLLGGGISTNDFQARFGANGISFYLYSFGILGFFFFLFWIFQQAGQKRRLIVVSVLFAMTSYPLFTYAIWWAWLGALMAIAAPGVRGSFKGREEVYLGARLT